MKVMYRVVLTAAAFVFLMPLSARSEIREGSFEVGAFGGYNSFEDSQNLENRPVFGGRLGYNFTKHIGIEGVVEYIGSRVDDKSRTGHREGQYRSPMDSVDLTFYHIDALYHFMPEGKFTPFIVAGFGGAHYSPKISTRDMAAFNVGVGAKYWVSDRIAFRVDLRDHMVTEVFQETYHNIGATAGITVALGGKAKSEPTPIAKNEPAPTPDPMAKENIAREIVAGLLGSRTMDNRLEVKGERPAENSDEWLMMKVKTTLLFHRSVNGFNTEVNVKDGIVTLQGKAISQAQKDQTTKYARDIEGVKDVKNEMTVVKTSKKGRKADEKSDDTSITTQVMMTLLYHRSTSTLDLSVTTKKGVVTLSGKAKNATEKDLATKLVNDVNGVQKVKNLMVIEKDPATKPAIEVTGVKRGRYLLAIR